MSGLYGKIWNMNVYPDLTYDIIDQLSVTTLHYSYRGLLVIMDVHVCAHSWKVHRGQSTVTQHPVNVTACPHWCFNYYNPDILASYVFVVNVCAHSLSLSLTRTHTHMSHTYTHAHTHAHTHTYTYTYTGHTGHWNCSYWKSHTNYEVCPGDVWPCSQFNAISLHVCPHLLW